MEEYGNIGVQTKTHHQAVPESVIKWRMDTHESIVMMEGALLGKEYNHKTRTFGPALYPICNSRGGTYAKTILSSAINQASIQGNITEEQYYSLMEYASDSIIEDVAKKYREFGILPDLRSTFVSIIMQTLALVLTRPIKNLEREGAIAQSQERVTTSQGIQSVMPGYSQMN